MRTREGQLTAFSSKPDQVLVVPPMALAWLAEAEGGKIMVSFEARGHSDATVLLSSGRSVGRQLRGNASNYTVIIGSHRNSCVKIEKNGVVVCQVQTRGATGGGSLAGSGPSSPVKSRVRQLHPMQLDPDIFRTFWVSYGHGEIRIGHGTEAGDAFCAWRDAVDAVDAGDINDLNTSASAGVMAAGSMETNENEKIRHIGLSSWNTHVGYRNVLVKTVRDELGECGNEDMDVDHEGVCGGREMTFYAGDTQEARPDLSTMSLLGSCLRTMQKTVSLDTVCGYLSGLDRLTHTLHGSGELFACTRERVLAFAATNIEELSIHRGGELCMLPSCVMEDIVKHQAVPCSEMVVYDVVRRWYEANGADVGIEVGCAFKILRHVRFPLMSSDELESLRRQRGSMSASSRPPHSSSWEVVLQDLIQEASDYHTDCKRMTSLYDPSIFIDGVLDGKLRLPTTDADGGLRFRERSPSGCVSLVYMYDGDTNGVFEFVGTRYGTAPWANPVAAGLVSISSSSPVGRFCDPRALVGRSFSSLNFAGPRRSVDGGVESWWKIELRHRLRCTRYAVRHDGSSDYIRNWVFQGSADGISWITLDEHVSDATIHMPAQWASWPVRDARRRTFQHFRILQTAPNMSAPNPMHLSLDHVELYGDFHIGS